MLPRLRSQPGVLAAVVASILLATTLLAAGPVLAAAVADGGLRADLAEAAPPDIGIEVELRTSADRAADATAAVIGVIEARLGERVDEPDVFVSAGTVHLQGQPDEVVTPVAVAEGALTDVFDDRRLLQVMESGRVLTDAQPVLLHDSALEPLGVEVGDVVVTDDGAAVQVVGTVTPADPGDRRWWDDPVGRDGVVPGVDFTRIGPLYVESPADLAPLLGPEPTVAVRIRTLPVLDQVTPETLVDLAADAAGLTERIDLTLSSGELADTWTVDPALATAAQAATVSLAATRAAVIATVGQVAVLAIYTLGLAGRLLRSGREVETLLVRARGATPEQLGWAAALEGVVLVVPAVLAAPWLATVAVRGLALVGVTEGSALALDPAASWAALGAAAVAGAACLVVLVVPAVTAARRTYAAAREGRGRRSPVGAVQALGLDLALAVLAGIGIWQLRSSGGPLGAGVPRDAGDVDPILVVAPALGLLAGALLVLRLVPGLARAGERVATRVRGLVAGLGGWQVARRPDAVSRPTLLLVLGVAVGVLASTYGATWRTSQADQADAAVGADIVLEPDRRVGALEDRFVPVTLQSEDGVTDVRPVHEASVSLVAGATTGTLLGIDATEPLLRVRADTAATVPLAELDVPPLRGMELPVGEQLSVALERVADPNWEDLPMEVTLVVRDGLGLVHRLEDRPVAVGTSEAAWPLVGMVAPVELVAVLLDTQTGDIDGRGYVGPPLLRSESPPPPVLDVRIGPPTVDDVVTAPAGAWVTDPYTSLAAFPPTHDATRVGVDGWRLTGTTGVAGQRGRLATLAVVHPDAAAVRTDAAPAVVHPDVLTATGRDVGDELVLTTSGAPVRLAIVGTTRLVPGFVDARLPVVVDHDAVTAARWATDRTVARPTDWLVALDDGLAAPTRRELSERLTRAWGTPPVDAPVVRSIAADEADRRGDPIAVGLVAALTLGALAAVALAVLGTVSSAVVSVRERAAEFALLQAVGTSLRQLRWWLAAEVGVVVAVGVLAGGALGALLVWAVLPTIALAADGSLAVPSPVVVVPTRTLVVAGLVVIGAFTLVPVVLTRVVARAHVAEVLRLGEDT